MKDLLPNIEVYRVPSDFTDESDAVNGSDSDRAFKPAAEGDSENTLKADEAAVSLQQSGPPDDVVPTREPVHIILIGSGISTNLVIGVLHTLGFAEPRAWSKAQVDPNSGKPMRILTKWVRH
ncbi:MAG: hypothetical protein AAFQ57_15970 [Cyanobacteria bacterium J06626_14]